jgi:DNA-binding LytR/AlgR family response regulator
MLEIMRNKIQAPYLVKTDYGKKPIPIQEILYIEASGAYINIITKDEIYTERNSLSQIETLFQNKLIRVHRSFLVNSDKIDQYNSKSLYIGDKEIPISRGYKSEIEKVLLKN